MRSSRRPSGGRGVQRSHRGTVRARRARDCGLQRRQVRLDHGQHLGDRARRGRVPAHSDVTPASVMPHGHDPVEPATGRGSQLSAKPCIVTPCATRTPIAATLRSGRRGRRRAARRRCGRRPGRPSTPSSAQTSMSSALEPADVGDHVDRVGQPHDRIADELARAVPGDLAAAVDVDDRGAVGRAAPRARCACRRCRPAGARAAARCPASRPRDGPAWSSRWRAQACSYGTSPARMICMLVHGYAGW